MSTTSTLGTVAEVVTPSRHRHLTPTQIRHCDPGPLDRYAPAPKDAQCRDRAGYLRRHHEWLHESPRGLRCVWCGKALSERARGSR